MTTNKFAAAATEFEVCLPPVGDAKRTATTGLIPAIINLISAFRSGDPAAISAAFLALLTILLGSTPTQNAADAQAAGIDWKSILALLAKWLPLILGA